MRLSQRLRHRLPPAGGHPRRHPELSGPAGRRHGRANPRCPDRCTAPLREDAQALAETAVDEYAVIYDVQCRPAYFAPMQQSGETVQVTLREILRVDHLRQGVIAATRTSVDHTLTLRRQTDGWWQVCGDSYEALGHTCAVTP